MLEIKFYGDTFPASQMRSRGRALPAGLYVIQVADELPAEHLAYLVFAEIHGAGVAQDRHAAGKGPALPSALPNSRAERAPKTDVANIHKSLTYSHRVSKVSGF